MADDYKAVEREYLDTGDPEDDDTFRIVRAVLMVAAELRKLRELLDQRLGA